MRIWILNHNLREEGTWHRAWNIARQFQRHGHNVVFFTVHPSRRLWPHTYISDGVLIHETSYLFSRRLAASGLDGWDIVWRVMTVLFGKWDVLYAFASLPNVSIPFLIAKLFFRRRFFLADWDDLLSDGGIYEYLNQGITCPLYRCERWLEIKTKKIANGVTTTSHFLQEKAKSIRNGYGVAYLPTGANIDLIQVMNKAVVRKQVEVPNGKIILVYLSGGYNNDGVMLLDAFVLALKQKPELFLVFIGVCDPRYSAVIDKAKVGDSVMMVSRIPFSQVPKYLGIADMLLMPMLDSVNNRARGPIKLKDYLCAGRPIVGTALGEVKYVLSRYAVGKLADLPSSSFAQKIVELANDPETMEANGREARRIAEQELSWDVIGNKVQQYVLKWCR